jgi:hypothetical protein
VATGPDIPGSIPGILLRSSGSGTGSTQLVRITEELFEWESSSSGVENRA